MSSQEFPIEVLRTELESDTETSETVLEDDEALRFESWLVTYMTSMPTSQWFERRVVDDVDWFIGQDAPLLQGMQLAIASGAVKGAATNRISKPRDFVKDIESSVDEVLIDTSLDLDLRSSLSRFAKLLRRGRTGKLDPRKVKVESLADWCERFDLDPFSLLDAFKSLIRPFGADSAVIAGRYDDEHAWEDLQDRMARLLESGRIDAPSRELAE